MLIQICHHVALLDHNKLTHLPLMHHICVNRLTIIGWDNGLTLNRRHYLNQCSVIVKWTFRNRYQWNINQNTNFFIHENGSENIDCETVAIFPGEDELTRSHPMEWAKAMLATLRAGLCYEAQHSVGQTSDGVVGITYTPKPSNIYRDLLPPPVAKVTWSSPLVACLFVCM